MLTDIRKAHDGSRGAYGSPRVYRALKKLGVKAGRHKIARIMRENGIRGRVVTVTKRRPGLKQFQQAGENLRRDKPSPTKQDTQWVADITYLKVGANYQYLITIMDVYSRRLLGWSLSERRTADDVLVVLKRVLARRKPAPGLIFHTDRGIEFMAYVIRDELTRHGILASYNRLGHCTDNGHMESFYHTLKGELIRGRKFKTAPELRTMLASYIDGFYNRTRMHSGISYESPINYEKQAA